MENHINLTGNWNAIHTVGESVETGHFEMLVLSANTSISIRRAIPGIELT